MEIEKVWLEVMFKIISEMVKFVEKIKGISINYVMGMGFLGGGDGSVKVFVSQVIDLIFDMVVQMFVFKKIGDVVGMNIEDSLLFDIKFKCD